MAAGFQCPKTSMLIWHFKHDPQQVSSLARRIQMAPDTVEDAQPLA